jgi:lysozyme family protein
MAQLNYPRCLEHVLKWEGGYVDHPKDPGGATNYGITRATLAKHRGRPVSKADVKELSIGEAGQIYKPGYWDTVAADDLMPGVDLVAFDASVNSGPRRGAKWLQKALGVPADGKVGPVTISAAAKASAPEVVKRACKARMGFLQGLSTWRTFGRGWSRRVADTEAVALVMAATEPKQVVQEEQKKAAQQKTALRNATVGPAGAGSGVALSDLPEPAVIAVVAISVLLAVLLLIKSRQQADRVAALKNASEAL